MRIYPLRTAGGFTLMELLVGILVGMLVIAGVTTTFIVQNRVASVQDATSDMQLAGQVAVDLLARDLRMAGYNVDRTTTSNAFYIDDNASGDAKRVDKTDAFYVNYSTTTRHKYYYYIEDGNKVTSRPGGLTRLDMVSNSVDTIASNVEDMQVTSSLDSSTGALTVSLSLLVKSLNKDPNYTDTPPSIGGVSVSADGYRRRVYTATVRARNFGFAQ